MNFLVRNRAHIANKYIRFAKWKIIRLSRRFQDVLYSEIYVSKIASSPEVYSVKIKLGVPGPDIIVSEQSHSLSELWSNISRKIKRQLRKHNAK